MQSDRLMAARMHQLPHAALEVGTLGVGAPGCWRWAPGMGPLGIGALGWGPLGGGVGWNG